VSGIAANFTEDSWRGGHALIIAFLRDDYEGQHAITAHATPAELLGIASAAVAIAAGALTFTGHVLGEADPDAFAEHAAGQALRAALAVSGEE
jgi:Na+-driven multidrug efflux pump